MFNLIVHWSLITWLIVTQTEQRLADREKKKWQSAADTMKHEFDTDFTQVGRTGKLKDTRVDLGTHLAFLFLFY